MNLYSNGERVIRATGKAYEAIYQAQGFRPYVEEEIEEYKSNGDAGGEKTDGEGKQPDDAGEADENGTGAEDAEKGKKSAAGRKPAADK